MTAKQIRRPAFLDWRYWLLLAVAVGMGMGVVASLGLDGSAWRWLIYVINGGVALYYYEQWVEWNERKGQAR